MTDPVVCPFDGFRPTVAALLVTPNDGILLVQSAKAARGQWGLLQGGIKEGESVLDALNREAEEELPDACLVLTGMVLCGDCVNEMPVDPPRDSPDKWMCVVAVPIESVPKSFNSDEIGDLCEVSNPFALESLLNETRPKKRAIIGEAVAQAHRLGLLGWTIALDRPVRVAA